MAYQIPMASDTAIARALVLSYSALRKEVATGLSKVHADITATSGGDYRAPTSSAYLVTAANATNLATLVALCQNIYRVYTTHTADTEAHSAADGTNTIAAGLLADTAVAGDCVTFINQAKAAYNAHRSQSGVHPTDDSGNAVSSSTATDQASAITMANEMKGDLNAHVQASLTSAAVKLLGA